jgi:beta-barrel assembly-enhancing protease
MKIRVIQTAVAITISMALAVTPVIGKSKDKKKKKSEDKNNPALIGKREINKGQLSFYSLDKEVALGRQLASEVDRSSKFITDPAVTEYVNRVGQNLVLHSDAKVPFTIKVIDSNEVNAFALPGGFLYVNRGLLEAADNEAEVAGVLSHEIAHVTARHGIEQASKGQLINYASLPLIFLGGGLGSIIQQVASIAVPLTFLKFSRNAEKEADRLGAQYMWASGYDPNSLISFFEKLQSKEKAKPGTLSKLFSTHPLTGDRIKEVREVIREFPDRNEYQITTSEFNGMKTRLNIANAVAGRTINTGDDRRPTLKRRPQTAGEGGTTASDSSSDERERPALKRKDGTPASDEGSKAPEVVSKAPEKAPDAGSKAPEGLCDAGSRSPEEPCSEKKP